MASIIRRAKDLGCISNDKYRYFNIEMSRRGYKKHEPINVWIDSPSVFYDAYTLFKTELFYSDNDLVEAFNLPINIIKSYCERTALHVRLKPIKA